MSLASVLIVDEESGQHVGADLEATLQRESIYHTKLIGLPKQRPIEILEQSHQLVIAVLPSSVEKAKGLLAEFRALDSDTPLMLVIRSEAISNGFCDPLAWTKDVMITPLREPEVCFRVRRLISGEQRETAAERIAEVCGLAQLVGEDAAFVALKRRIPIAAQFESTVLLTGETGTGKERFARALHYCSRRAGEPFIPVNCGAIPVDLFENEMYGLKAIAGSLCRPDGKSSIMARAGLSRFEKDLMYDKALME